MSTLGKRSMMWRTTYVFGALGFGSMLAYMGVLAARDVEHGFAFRIFVASALLLGACVCALTAARELRGAKPRHEKPFVSPSRESR